MQTEIPNYILTTRQPGSFSSTDKASYITIHSFSSGMCFFPNQVQQSIRSQKFIVKCIEICAYISSQGNRLISSKQRKKNEHSSTSQFLQYQLATFQRFHFICPAILNVRLKFIRYTFIMDRQMHYRLSYFFGGKKYTDTRIVLRTPNITAYQDDFAILWTVFAS